MLCSAITIVPGCRCWFIAYATRTTLSPVLLHTLLEYNFMAVVDLLVQGSVVHTIVLLSRTQVCEALAAPLLQPWRPSVLPALRAAQHGSLACRILVPAAAEVAPGRLTWHHLPGWTRGWMVPAQGWTMQRWMMRAAVVLRKVWTHVIDPCSLQCTQWAPSEHITLRGNSPLCMHSDHHKSHCYHLPRPDISTNVDYITLGKCSRSPILSIIFYNS